MSKRVSWSSDDIDTLRRVFPNFPNRKLADMLGRSYGAIYQKAFRLGLHKGVVVRPDLNHNLLGGCSIDWTPSMLSTLRREFSITKNEDLAVILGVSERTVVRKARELGLHKDRAWCRALWRTNIRLAHGVNKLCDNNGRFYKGMPPTASSFRKGHIPVTIQPVVRLDTLEIYPSTHAAGLAFGCAQSNVSCACYRHGNVRGVAVRFCRDMPCGSCRFLVGLSPEETTVDSICGCGLDSHITTTETTGCKKYQPVKTE